MRYLCVDPGDKRIGIAVSDLSGTIANPYSVINHVQREKDALQIITIAEETGSEMIIIGQALTDDGEPSPSGRKSARLASVIKSRTKIPVVLWDESGSTDIARQARLEMGVGKKKRRGHMDDLAAAVILQTYLDAFRNVSNSDQENFGVFDG
jgi:putative Holliday junction resolvase